MKTIERLRELEKSATPGPWYTDAHDCPDIVRATGGGGVLCGSYHDANVGTANVELAKELRNALPALLAVVEAQAAEIAAWREFQEEAESRSWSKAWLVHAERLADAYDNTDADLRALEGGDE